ncbi:MAG: hypothetical protein SFY67_02415 [Candidatus Melainabacteria bacterium]|nr:hypothetical protein [Candidatus Melainabacteria bacterium]
MEKLGQLVSFFHTASDMVIVAIIFGTLIVAYITLKIVTGKDTTWYDRNL